MKIRPILTALFAFAAASASHAALMYSGVQNVPIPVTVDGVYFRISDGATTGTFPGDWSTAPWLNPFQGGVYVANSDFFRPIVIPGTAGTEQIVNLAPGTVIDATGNFAAGENGSGDTGADHTGPAANQFQFGTPGVIGFAFKTAIAGPEYYGWLRMTVDNSGPGGTIVDWAYESTAGAAIIAVPEAGTALVGLALCGIGIFRRRR